MKKLTKEYLPYNWAVLVKVDLDVGDKIVPIVCKVWFYDGIVSGSVCIVYDITNLSEEERLNFDISHYEINSYIDQMTDEEIFTDTVIYTTCSTLSIIDTYVFDIVCDVGCQVENGEFKLDTIKYDNISLYYQIESFTHPQEWSTNGENRYIDQPDYKHIWNELTPIIEEKIHDGEYDYELAFKSYRINEC